MNYEKKYNKALKKAKKLYEQGIITESLNYVFPELKESRVENVDEKVRKALIKLVTNHASMDLFIEYDIHLDEALAWLEKQGKKSSDKIVEKARTEKQRVLLTETDGSANIDWDCRSLQDVKLLLEYGLDYIKKLEKQSEQKSADKAEPKFHEGEWINGYYTNYKVLSVNNDGYVVEDVDGNKINILFENEKFHHLWTIQDAKPGDVLVCKGNIKYSNGIKYERICLFNNVDKAFFTLTKTSNFVEEYGIDVNIDYPDNTVPATKEQKEILFMVMKEAGYEYDAEKKELKKIEPKAGDWLVHDERRIIIKVLKATPLDYEVVDVLGYHHTITDDAIKNNYHLWTIQDAKDGDVLTYRNGQWIFIYKEKIDDSSFYYHTLYSTIHQDLTINDSAFTLLEDAIIPATKEQCDLLFAKMKEAGYEWNPIEKRLMEVPKTKEEGGVLGKLINEPKELTEFESELCRLFQNFRWKDKSVTNETVLDYVESHSDELLSIARKQIVSEIDVDAIVTDYKTMLNKKGVETFDGFAASVYRQGINRVIEKIKN